MKEVIYTKHAIDKFRTRESKQFKITKKSVEEVVLRATYRQELPTGVIRAVGKLKQNYSLVVVYKRLNEMVKIVTFFPAEKGRYESKVLS